MLCQLELLARTGYLLHYAFGSAVAPRLLSDHSGPSRDLRCFAAAALLALGSALQVKPCIRDARYAPGNSDRTS
jgi:hypothetical protein